MISVIIVTKDRPWDVEHISLRSLMDQDCKTFEVLIWDASSSDETEKVCFKLKDSFLERNVELKYFKAPRVGIPSQRNDAVEKACGDVVFFIDDDSEVSSDGVRVIAELFKSNPEVMGAGLPLVDVPRTSNSVASTNVGSKSLKSKWYSRIGYVSKRTVNIAGSTRGTSSTFPEAQWLSGGSMAFRKKVFNDMKFNEVLETFAPYANGEDVEFSHRVYLKFQRPLRISSKGEIIHRPAPVSRVSDPRTWIATLVFNRFQILKVASGSLFWLGFLGYFWSMIRLFRKMSRQYGSVNAWSGFRLAIRRLLADRHLEMK